MALLRPVKELAAENAREEVDNIYEDMLAEVSRHVFVFREPERQTVTVAMREGRSLYQPVARRSYRKGGRYPRWSEV